MSSEEKILSLILENSCLLHVPKMAGTYIKRVLEENGIPHKKIKNQTCTENLRLINRGRSGHCIPYEVYDFRQKKEIACFVRHPLDWYKSYWAFRVQHERAGHAMLGWRIGNGQDGFPGCILDEKCNSSSFENFIDEVINEFEEGPLSQAFKEYESISTFVGKVENLDRDLFQFLSKAENIPEVFFPKDKVNTSKKHKKSEAFFREDQIRDLRSLEEHIFQKYQY